MCFWSEIGRGLQCPPSRRRDAVELQRLTTRPQPGSLQRPEIANEEARMTPPVTSNKLRATIHNRRRGLQAVTGRWAGSLASAHWLAAHMQQQQACTNAAPRHPVAPEGEMCRVLPRTERDFACVSKTPLLCRLSRRGSRLSASPEQGVKESRILVRRRRWPAAQVFQGASSALYWLRVLARGRVFLKRRG